MGSGHGVREKDRENQGQPPGFWLRKKRKSSRGRKVDLSSHWLHWRYSVVAPFLTYPEALPTTSQPGPIALAIALSPPSPLWALLIPMTGLVVPSDTLSGQILSVYRILLSLFSPPIRLCHLSPR